MNFRTQRARLECLEGLKEAQHFNSLSTRRHVANQSPLNVTILSYSKHITIEAAWTSEGMISIGSGGHV